MEFHPDMIDLEEYFRCKNPNHKNFDKAAKVVSRGGSVTELASCLGVERNRLVEWVRKTHKDISGDSCNDE